MTLGALLDAGLEAPELEKALNSLGLPRVRLKVQEVSRQHLRGLKVDFETDAPQPQRTYRDIVALIEAASLTPKVKDLAISMFRLLGEVEAKIHGQPLESVHFHELGALDTILDVVGVAFGVESLGIGRVYCSALPQGRGRIAAAHGLLPNPAPATLELLRGFPVYGVDLAGELVTPTGAAILRALEAQPEPCPPILLERTGYGAGSWDFAGHPNLLRLWVGTPLAREAGLRERVLVLETHLDDMIPELYEPLMEGLFAAGALDVALSPIQMKKNRPGVGLTVIAPVAAREGLLLRLFTDSTTLGVRLQEVERVTARRWPETLETPFGPLTVKVTEYGGRRRLMPEYEDCRRLARERGLPLLEVYRLVPSGEPE
ncbi:MAG: nickel pincer cofactor biosynthesis protein LarC [Deltaproteobacteria bacterium]|nr:nickel pincer cofactor biosynthesis protein LarC [Deltaproteobacteria bacterium]